MTQTPQHGYSIELFQQENTKFRFETLKKFSLEIGCFLGPFWGYACKDFPLEIVISSPWVILGLCMQRFSLETRCLFGPFWGSACKSFPCESVVSLGHSEVINAKVFLGNQILGLCMQMFPWESDVSWGHFGVMHAKIFHRNWMSPWAILGLCMQRFSLGIRCLLGPFWGFTCKGFPYEPDVFLGHSGVMHAKVFFKRSDVSLCSSGLMHAKVYIGNQMSSWAILALCMQKFSLGIKCLSGPKGYVYKGFHWESEASLATLGLCIQRFSLEIGCLLGPFWGYACKGFLWESDISFGHSRVMYTKVFFEN